MKSITVPVAPLQRPALAHKFMVSIIFAPLAKNITGCKSDMSSELRVLAVGDECRASMRATGCWSLVNFS